MKLAEIPQGKFVTLAKVTPTGSLQARRGGGDAISFFWRYSIGAASERVSIGQYDAAAPPKSLTPTPRGYSVAAAIRAAESMAAEHRGHREHGGRPALVAEKQAAAIAAQQAKEHAASASLENLLILYCDHLESIGRRSHKDARSIFRLHVIQAWPAVAARPANELTGEHFADMMRSLIEHGKGRTANKLRSYCRAAYQTAKAARSKPSIPIGFKHFGVVSNPVAETEPDETQNRPDKKPLNLVELRSYWRAIRGLAGFKGALLRLHLLTGGQRVEQLVNLRTADVHADRIVLRDGKGRPGRPPRPHVVPLIRLARASLLECQPKGLFALSTDGGATHVAATTLSEWASQAAGDKIVDFQCKRIRSGVETLLASAGVTMDVRGRLQSHGVSGVQSRHYDGHDYLAEKRKALTTLYKLLQSGPPN